MTSSTSPLPTPSNAGLEYVDDTTELLEVGSAVCAVDTHYVSPTLDLSPDDLNEPDF